MHVAAATIAPFDPAMREDQDAERRLLLYSELSRHIRQDEHRGYEVGDRHSRPYEREAQNGAAVRPDARPVLRLPERFFCCCASKAGVSAMRMRIKQADRHQQKAESRDTQTESQELFIRDECSDAEKHGVRQHLRERRTHRNERAIYKKPRRFFGACSIVSN